MGSVRLQLARNLGWFVSLLGIARYPILAQCHVEMGIADGQKATVAGNFCYVIPQGSVGHLEAQIIVRDPGHEVAIFRAEDVPNLDSKDCKEILKNAEIKAALTNEMRGPDGKEHMPASLFELKMRVESSLSDKDVVAVLTHCGAELDLSYKLTFINPGGWWIRHFSCSDRAILPSLLLVTIAGLCGFGWIGYVCATRRHSITEARAAKSLSLAVVMWTGWLMCNMMHVLAFAQNGIGVITLARIARLLDGLLAFLVSGLMWSALNGVDPKVTSRRIQSQSLCSGLFVFVLIENFDLANTNGVFAFAHRHTIWAIAGEIWRVFCAAHYICIGRAAMLQAARKPHNEKAVDNDDAHLWLVIG